MHLKTQIVYFNISYYLLKIEFKMESRSDKIFSVIRKGNPTVLPISLPFKIGTSTSLTNTGI